MKTREGWGPELCKTKNKAEIVGIYFDVQI